MQTIKTCTLDDSKRHVCFADLAQYWRKDEYLTGLNDIEKLQVKQNLGIVDNDLEVDRELSKASKNPVQNRVVAFALDKKADINTLSKIAITGQYQDLKNPPCTMPNPEGLIVDTHEGSWFYDGTTRVQIAFPDKLSQFENDVEFVDKCYVQDAIEISGIRVNGVKLTPDFDKMVNIEFPTRLSDFTETENFVKVSDIDTRVVPGSANPVSSEAVAQEIGRLNESLILLNTRLTQLQDFYETLRQNG